MRYSRLLIDLSGTIHIGDKPTRDAVASLRRLRKSLEISQAAQSQTSNSNVAESNLNGQESPLNQNHQLDKVIPTVACLRFVTNTTKESQRKLYERLVDKIGFTIRKDEIFSSLSAAKRLLKQLDQGKDECRPLLMLSNDAMEDFADWQECEKIADDLIHSIGDPEPVTDSATVSTGQTNSSESRETEMIKIQNLLSDQQQKTNLRLNTVVVGLAPDQFNYERLSKAMNILLESDTNKLIAIHKARYLARDSNTLALGPGAIISALEYATGRSSQDTVVVGKPSSDFYTEALRSMYYNYNNNDNQCHWDQESESDLLDKTVMIGDDILDDCCGALQCGIDAILVRTGKYRIGDEKKYELEILEAIEIGKKIRLRNSNQNLMLANGNSEDISNSKTSELKFNVFEDFSEAVDWILEDNVIVNT